MGYNPEEGIADMQELGDNESYTKALASHSISRYYGPFTLREALHRVTMPFEYVHRAKSRRLEREEEADKIWA